MGVMDKFLNYMRINPDEDDEYYYDEYEDEPVEEKPKKQPVVNNTVVDQSPVETRKVAPKVTPISRSKKTLNSGMEVCIIRPTAFEDAREIADTLLAGSTIVLNMEGLDTSIAQRIIDFTCGSCYAIDGKLQKISNYIFIVTPKSVDISGDFQDLFTSGFDVPSF